MTERSVGSPRGPDTRHLRDHLKPGVRVLFVGINPGLRSAAIGHHFAGYSNRFWKLLHDSNLTPVRLTTEQDGQLPNWGYGITNLVPRATRGIDELRPSEYAAARRTLLRKIARFRPKVVALVGVTLYRMLFPSADPRKATRLGLQHERLGDAPVVVLPNPSGRNANFSYTQMLKAFIELRIYLDHLES